MSVVDCAGDKEMAVLLTKYVTSLGNYAKQDDSLVLINAKNVIDILKLFLKDTGKSEYCIQQADPGTFVLAKVVPIDNFGLATCEICGFVAFDEELFAHRRAHGI
jgi:hypothetical protein